MLGQKVESPEKIYADLELLEILQENTICAVLHNEKMFLALWRWWQLKHATIG